MKLSLIALVMSLFINGAASAAMVRVIGVEDAHTIVVEDRGRAVRVTLAGVAITDASAAKSLLEWTLASQWVLLEQNGGGHLVYRSPDALFVNRELVLRGYAKATLHEVEPETHVIVTYLGVVSPGAEKTVAPKPAKVKAAPKTTSVRPGRARGSGSGTSRRSTSGPSRKRRAP